MEQLELRMTTDLATAMPAEIGFNFDELKSALVANLEYYNHLVVTEDTIQEGKADLANLRKLQDALQTRRKDVKKVWNQPLTTFESQVKELVALIDEPVRTIDSKIKGFAEQQRQQKLTEIEGIYAEVVPENLKEIIPLHSKILDPTWLNKTTSLKKVREAIETLTKRTNVDMVLIDGVNPKFMAAVRKKYIDTLDITAALNYQDELLAAEEQFRQQEEARQQREAQRAAWANQAPTANEMPPVAAQEPVAEPAPQPAGEKVYSLRLEFQLTMDQANRLKRFLSENRIQYTKI